ncbi:MAG: hypothetical protein ACYDEA_02340 [Candidatus Dormibacteria bacterium]
MLSADRVFVNGWKQTPEPGSVSGLGKALPWVEVLGIGRELVVKPGARADSRWAEPKCGVSGGIQRHSRMVGGRSTRPLQDQGGWK